MSSSRTNLRLQLMREQTMHDQQAKLGVSDFLPDFLNGSQSPAVMDSIASSSPLAIRPSATNSSALTNGGGGSSLGSGGGSVKTSPIIISQPVRFSGNRLMHLPPHIIHVQQQHLQQRTQQTVGDDMGRRNLTLSSSLPPGLPQKSPPTLSRMTNVDSVGRVATPQYSGVQHQQYRAQSTTTSRQSPDDLSAGGYGDSPQSNSFTSAQSELDDIIIDEILSMEEEQQKRDPQTATSKMLNSLSYADNLEALLTSGRNVPFHRQVSNSAPTSTIDIEGLVREELLQEQDMMRDRRKKDIHNMIERRRRYNINDRIKELGTLLPKACTEDLKLNKGTILKASVEYIRVLRRDQEKLHQMLHRYQNVEQDNKIMALRIHELEQRLKQNGIPVPSPESSFVPDSQIMDRRSMVMDGRSRLIDRPIKTEPLDDDQTPQPRPDHPPPTFHMLASLQQQHPPPLHQQLPPLPQGVTIGQAAPHHIQHTSHLQQQAQQLNRGADCSAGMIGHSYAASSDTQLSSFYVSAPTSFAGDGGVLEIPPIVNDNLSFFGERRPPLGLVNQHATQRPSHLQPQQHQHASESIMDFGDHAGGGGVASSTVGNLVSSSTAALISSSDPLMSDSRLANSQIASPDVQWDSQAFSPEMERMDFMAP